MSERNFQLRLQAYWDGELPDRQRKEVEAQLAHRPELARLLEHFKAVDTALDAAGEDATVPESREFYWSKIQSAITRSEQAPAANRRASWLGRWREWLMPAGAVAGLALVLVLAVYGPSNTGQCQEASFADPGAFTYRDFSQGMTLVWLSYPAEK